jgi:DNA helicase II / ATP-dependent DNA helicase PcrA
MTPQLSSGSPTLDGDALKAVLHRGSHLQIIASAGSGKTEVVAQRFAQLLAGGEDPASIIAFTFTERAARELKARISARVEQRMGSGALDRLGAAFVGIHGYCFRLLQHHVPHYETFDVDERRLSAFLCREEPTLKLKQLAGGRMSLWVAVGGDDRVTKRSKEVAASTKACA